MKTQLSLAKLKAIFGHNPAVASTKAKNSTLKKIDAYLLSKHNAEPTYTSRPSHSPSSFGSKCLRKIYYTYFKVPKDSGVTAKVAKIFETGNAYESMVMDWLKAIGEHVPYRNKAGVVPPGRDGKTPDPQFPVSIPEWSIKRGYIDNVAIVDGELWIYEIKSSASYKFNGLEAPMDDHLTQTACYFKAMNDHLAAGDFSHLSELDGIQVSRGVKLIYVNRDTSEIKMFVLEKSELNREVRAIAAKVDRVQHHIAANALPSKTEDKCSYCPFSKKCKQNWNGVPHASEAV